MTEERAIRIVARGFKVGASDIHMTPGLPPVFRIRGHLMIQAEEPPLDQAFIGKWGAMILKGTGMEQQMEAYGHADLALEFPEVGRLRINLYVQSNQWTIALRLISPEIPKLNQLGLPDVVQDLLRQDRGLLVVSGAAGNGKSTTLAAMIGYINEYQRRHVITLEDPIEYRHSHHQSIISQREIGRDTPKFASGLQAALRQDPDVIMVGEMRDMETISIVLTAAETGHLVLTSLHARSAAQTLERIIDVFPSPQTQIRGQLASSLLGIVNQELIVSADGQMRCLAAEVMVNNSAIGNLIRENKIHQIYSVIQTSGRAGMISMKNAVETLVLQNKVSPHELRKRTGKTQSV